MTAETSARFGSAVSASGDTIAVGSPQADLPGATDAGVVTVFVRSGTTWSQQARLTAPTPVLRDQFGAVLALAGDTLVIGAAGADPGGVADAGAGYVFTRSGTTWSLQATLLAADAFTGAALGLAAAIESDTVILGSRSGPPMAGDSGAAYVFTRSGTTWTQQAKLTPADASSRQGFSQGAVALSGDTAVIGALSTPVSGAGTAGAAYVFTRSGTTWSQQARLTAADAASLDWFGTSVAVSGDTAIIGAPGANVGTVSDAGAAYVFERSGTSWSQKTKLVATIADIIGSFLGYSVALQGDWALVGIPYSGLRAFKGGQAFLCQRSGGTFAVRSVLASPAAASEENYGLGVALASSNVAVLGAPGTISGGKTGSGSAYVYAGVMVKANGEVCTKGDECNSGYCVDSVCCTSACGDSPEDCLVCTKAKGASADGVCSAAPKGTICRAASGPCDAPDECSGVLPFCIAYVQSAGTPCRPSTGACDTAEACDGFDAQCPPDRLAPATQECRATAGPCDVAERCTGTSSACPNDKFSDGSKECRAAAGPCDVPESCSGGGAACPPDSFAAPKECRASAGPCDVAERCTGADAMCPQDQLAATTQTCRPASGPCDAPEYCSGASPGCPQEIPVNTCSGGGPDLGVALSGVPLLLAPGGEAAVRVDVRNVGQVVASAVTLRLDAQPGLRLVAPQATQEGFTCQGAETSLLCARPMLAGGASAALTVQAQSSGMSGLFTIAATVSAAAADPVPTNNTAALQLTVGQGQDVAAGAGCQCALGGPVHSDRARGALTLLAFAALLLFTRRRRVPSRLV